MRVPGIGSRCGSEVREGRREVLAPEGLEAGEPQGRGLLDGGRGRRGGGSAEETVRVVVGVLDDLVGLILAAARAVRALVRGQRPNEIERLALRSQFLLDLLPLFPLLMRRHMSFRILNTFDMSLSKLRMRTKEHMVKGPGKLDSRTGKFNLY